MADSTEKLVRSDAAVHAAIDRYEKACQDGELTFNQGKFADEPADTADGWVGSFLFQHLPAMDLSAGGAR